jgi:hypothetical protein
MSERKVIPSERAIFILAISNMSASFVDSPLLGVAISLPIVASAFVVLRIYANRRRGGGSVAGDDWTLFLTLVSFDLCCAR